MPSGSEFQREMEGEDRKEWLAAEYARLYEAARPFILERESLIARAKAAEEVAEAIARRAFGVLLASGWDEQIATKEIATWRKPAG